MALVKLGTTIAGLAGTIGGVTFSRCKAGTTARIWSKSSNPQTSFQQTTRDATSNWPQLWKDMSQADRDDWDLLAATPPETDYDRFGTVVLLSGYNWFVRINNRRIYTFQDSLLTAPAAVTPAAPVIDSFTAWYPTAATEQIFLDYNAAEFAADEFLIVQLNFAGSPGNRTKTTDFRLVGVLDAFGTDHCDLTTITLIRFGTYSLNWLATARCYRQTVDSFRSVPTVMRSTVINEP